MVTILRIGGDVICYDTRSNEPLKVPNSVTRIPNYFLSNCFRLKKSPIIPHSVQRIENYVLAGCQSLQEAPRIPVSVTHIGDFFLSKCKNLTEPPVILHNLTEIGIGFLFSCLGIEETYCKWSVGQALYEGVNSHPYYNQFSPIQDRRPTAYWKRKSLLRNKLLAYILNLPHLIFYCGEK